MDKSHADRVKKELRAVGVTRYGLLKSEGRHIPELIHQDEHIGGAVYGQIGDGASAYLIATDRRIIFYDHKPLYSTFDELTYDVVSGVKSNRAGFAAMIVLHTRVTDYTLRFVNPKCARIFVDYIEKRRLEVGRYDPSEGQYGKDNPMPVFTGESIDEGLAFLKSHDTAVLSTVDRTGNVHGAVIYYVTDENNFIYFMTKSGTGKGHNVYAHSQVALTLHQPGTQQTLQVQGRAHVESDQLIKDRVFSQIVKPRDYNGKTDLPPVTKLREGSFMIVKISPTVISYHDYARETS